MKNINTLQLFLYVFYLSGENKIRSSAKLREGLCISSYKTKIFKIEKQTLGLYSSIEYMLVKPNLKQFEFNSEQSFN